MQTLSAIIALTWGIVSAAQEECTEGESCPASPASGRSVLQKQQHRTAASMGQSEVERTLTSTYLRRDLVAQTNPMPFITFEEVDIPDIRKKTDKETGKERPNGL